MKKVNELSFEHDAPPGVNEYGAKSSVISVFYSKPINLSIVSSIFI